MQLSTQLLRTLQWILLALLIVPLLTHRALTQDTPADIDWADCLACHASPDADLPALADLRPISTGRKLRLDCSECHSGSDLLVAQRDWRHPVRSVAAHLTCTDCHPAVAHSAAAPPPMPKGDYVADACYSCHGDVETERHMYTRHDSRGNITCRACHPAHGQQSAALPQPLLPVNVAEAWHGGNDWYLSNSDCLACHSSASVFFTSSRGFHDERANLHELHIAQQGVMCIECHEPHGSLRHGLLRQRQVTGELLQVFESPSGGTCATICHGFDHDGLGYLHNPPNLR